MSLRWQEIVLIPEGEEEVALPLDGVLVVDATKFLAGPFGGLVLQDLGARVVKVDPPGGEEFRAVAAASAPERY